MSATDDVLIFEYDGSRLTYRRFGSGPAARLAFHGFGQSHAVFEATADLGITVYAVDLFSHGGSRYVGSELLTKTNWQRFIGAFLTAHGISRFSLMGFSLGGRFALATVEAFADRIDELTLIAPDGITRSPWYRLATGSAAGRTLFRYVLRHLTAFNRIGHALVRAGLLNRTAMRFAETSLATPEQRALVYAVWTQFRRVRPDLDRIATLLNEKPSRVRVIVGVFDRIVPAHYVLPLTKRLRRYELISRNAGHNRLIEQMPFG